MPNRLKAPQPLYVARRHGVRLCDDWAEIRVDPCADALEIRAIPRPACEHGVKGENSPVENVRGLVGRRAGFMPRFTRIADAAVSAQQGRDPREEGAHSEVPRDGVMIALRFKWR